MKKKQLVLTPSFKAFSLFSSIVISAFKTMHYMNLGEEDAKRAVVAAGTMLGISVLGSLIYLPILMKSLKGMRKVYIILRQICIIGFLLTQLLNHIIMNEAVVISSQVNAVNLLF